MRVSKRGFEWIVCSVVLAGAVVFMTGCPQPTVPVDNTNGNSNTNNNSTDPVCGNGTVEEGEQCDPPDGTTCNDACQTIGAGGAVCGDGTVEGTEECDPPDGTTCNDACKTIGSNAECGNGVVEAGEECDPPNPESCDEACQLIGDIVPVCGDMVIDPGEDCEPPNTETCDDMCQAIAVPAVCGNGVIEEGERCDPPDTETCDGNCQSITAGGVQCGNNVVEPGEDCDPPDGDTCDANCQNTTGGELANDSCAAPVTVTDGTRKYSNVGSTTDGPPACNIFGNPQVDSDIWFCYTATCDELVTVSLCGSLYDSKLAIYNGCDCPDTEEVTIGCSDDDCGAGQESRAKFLAIAGQEYMIRAGGFLGNGNDQGEGTLSIFCESNPNHDLATCRATSGTCFMANGTTGCNNVEVCEKTCAADPSCCDALWDDLCAEKADGIANGFDSCGPGNGSCFTPDGSAGCDDTSCCQLVCEADPFCCLTEWDQVCADAVPEQCGIFEACLGARGSCVSEHEAPGCNVPTCCTDVCAIDPLCCSDTWDEVCVALANQNCP